MSNTTSLAQMEQARPPRSDERRKEHDVDALLLLDRFMRIPQDAPLSEWPSTAELQAERIFGLRPVNRIGDLKKGKFNHHRYDFEMISCGHGVNRWRLHWPNRPGFPKDKRQTVLPLSNSPDWYERSTGKTRGASVASPTSAATEKLPLFEAVRP